MSNNALSNDARQRAIQAIMPLLAQQLPARHLLTASRACRIIVEVLRTHWRKLASIVLAAGGTTVLVPALLGVMGFATTGVLKGSLAALIQSVFWGANTGGIFSLFQSIGATAALAPPVGLVLGGLALFGAGYLWWHKGGEDTAAAASDNDDDDGPAGPTDPRATSMVLHSSGSAIRSPRKM